MIDLKRQHQNNNNFYLARALALTGLIFLLCRGGWADNPCSDVACGGDYSLTRSLLGVSGIANLPSGDYQLAFAFGEDISGQTAIDSTNTTLVISGYFGGHFGAGGNGGSFHLLSTTITGPALHQNGIQIGVPLSTSIQLEFSAELDPSTLSSGIALEEITDHLGQSQQVYVPIQFSYAVSGTSVTMTPQGTLSGNTLYEVVTSPSLLTNDGFSLADISPTPFVTLLDPQQQNVVLYPFSGLGNASGVAASNGTMSTVNLNIPSQSLSDYSAVLVNQDPIGSPLFVDPQIIKTANARALSSGGPYAVPIALQEVVAYDKNGQRISGMAQSAEFSFGFPTTGGLVGGPGSLVHPSTLSVYSLDQAHALWVKIPASQISAQGMISAPVSQFSVFALMGGSAGSASSSYVFPNPWRPHGPNAGTGLGQTGNEAGGMTFNNLPSECTIKIYTISGSLIRQLQHSDAHGTIGQEIWNGTTNDGDTAASGVYLWRVESSVDGQNGKLMIIR